MQINYDCPATWKLIQEGLSKSLFQCESKLVSHWLKQIKPENLWDLSAVIAIVRPGCLQSGFSDVFVAYRNGSKEFESFGHPIIDEVFNTTNHILLYQESLIALANKLAFKDLPELERLVKADNLRKAVGKKDQTKLLVIGKEFVDGCVKNGVELDIANKLLDVIKNCGRYLFNLSHSMAYAHICYKTAWLKVNYPLQARATYLSYAQFKNGQRKFGDDLNGKYKEIYEIIQECRIMGLDILPPNFNKRNENFKIEGESIRYGLAHLKGFGSNTFEKVKDFPQITHWHQIVIMAFTDNFGYCMNARTTRALITTGSFDVGVGRKDLLTIFETFNELTVKEVKWCVEHIVDYPDHRDIPKLLELCMTECCTTKRKETVRSLATIFKSDVFDHFAWIENEEVDKLGIAMTATAVDAKEGNAYNTCLECSQEFSLNTVKHISVVIDKVMPTTTKKGKNPGQQMARISVHDTTGAIENLPIFPDLFLEVSSLLIKRNTVNMCLKQGDRGWIVMTMEKI